MPIPHRNRSLDVLRAIAVLLVLGRHMPLATSTGDSWISDAIAVWHRGGWIGVDLFFVVSGFLVSRLLLREYEDRGSLDVGRFLVRRGFKIYPSFYFFFIVTIVRRLLWDEPLMRSGVVGEACFVQNYLGTLWGHTWSLAVEEHFYILLPLSLLALLQYRLASHPFAVLPRIIGVVCVLVLAARIANACIFPDQITRNCYATHF